MCIYTQRIDFICCRKNVFIRLISYQIIQIFFLIFGRKQLYNISKKKLKKQEKEAAAAAAREYEAKKNPAAASEKEEKKPLSGDASRPYAKGRAYDPSHYGKKASAADTDTKTEE